jgi:hypothetical protein
MADDDCLQITPSNATSTAPKKPRVKKEMSAEYLANLKRGREQLLVKKAEQRLKAEEAAISAKTDELRKSKAHVPSAPIPIPEPPAPEPTPPPPVVVAESAPAPVKQKKPRAPRVPREPKEPKERIVERIVEVERIVYQAPTLKFCFV